MACQQGRLILGESTAGSAEHDDTGTRARLVAEERCDETLIAQVFANHAAYEHPADQIDRSRFGAIYFRRKPYADGVRTRNGEGCPLGNIARELHRP